MARLLPRFLYLCVFVFIFISALMIYDSVRECSSEELIATRELLEKYSVRIQNLREERERLITTLEIQNPAPANLHSNWVAGLPVIYLITPTHTRAEQKSELTRLSHTLRLVNNVHWIVIEDSETKTELVTKFLRHCGLNYTHLSVQTPLEFKMAPKDPNWLKPRGVLQRNAGLTWLRTHVNSKRDKGVVYFADDDNTYSLELFEEMRFTKKVSVWPVGLVGYLRYERPIVQNGQVVRWFTAWKPDRPFPMDMAGFAVNVKLVLEYPGAAFSNEVQRGYQESTLLTEMQITLADLEPKANQCTEVLVWHTRTEKSKMKNEDKMIKKYGKGSDPSIEV